MVRFFNPGGHNWGPVNYDGYGISQVVFAVVYSVFFYIACGYVWHHRNHAGIKMRRIGLALLSVLILHIYESAVLIVYMMNGNFPCSVEFWTMSIYLPIGIGLFQAQNQQLLIISTGQNRLRHTEEYKPLWREHGQSTSGPMYWLWRLNTWWKGTSRQGKYEGYVLIGIIVQFSGALTIYLVSRKFSANGIVSDPASPGMCRRGWEWAPSIAWQLLWNYVFGPYLLWNIRGIHDIYHWRQQTIIAVVAGFPGTPLWLIAVYTDKFASVNKWWVPAMWLVPGLIAMELTTVLFPIMHIRKHKRQTRTTKEVLAAFDTKMLVSGPASSGSLTSPSINSKKGAMYSMESLDECLASDYDGLQNYATDTELNGENILFLTRVLKFRKQWDHTMSHSRQSSGAMTMFRVALGIYIHLIHAGTACYPINIESHVYAQLEKVFGPATAMMASKRRGSDAAPSISSAVTPWELESPSEPAEFVDEFPMQAIPTGSTSCSNESTEHILPNDDHLEVDDVLANMLLPNGFDNHVFDDAFKSVRYMVWTETWQHYMKSERTSSAAA